MAKAFSVASWNVEHFWKSKKESNKPKKPIGSIVDYLASQKVDIVAVYEVVGKMVFNEVMKKMPGYQFHITEGPQSQEILVGVKKNISCFFTQKITFKSGASILSIKKNAELPAIPIDPALAILESMGLEQAKPKEFCFSGRS